MPEPAAWFYVDDARTHAIRVRLEREPSLRLVIRESALGRDDPEVEAYVETHLLSQRWETRLHLVALERRLASLGRYRRMTAGKSAWERVARPPIAGGESATGDLLADLKPLYVRDSGVRFYHYENPGSPHAVTLVGVPRSTPRGERLVLARLDFSFPDVEGGHLQLVHAQLPPSVYQSALASLHLELAEQGFHVAKRPRSGVASDARWWAALQAVLDSVLERLLAGRVGKGDVSGRSGESAEAKAARAAIAGVVAAGGLFGGERQYDVEDPDLGPASAVHAKRGEKDFDHLDATILHLVHDPKLQALHDRYLPGETPRLLEEGELAIIDAIHDLKERTPPAEWHLVSILQASLLVRYAIGKRGRKLDVEALELLKHAPAWL